MEKSLTCFDIAKYFLSMVEEDAGDGISNLKIQKLVYYAQGFHLALFGKPLFNEAIEAWIHGPVIPDLYHRYKNFEANSIPIPKDINLEIFDDNTKQLLNEVNRVFGQFSAWKLRELTHNEPPWKIAYTNGRGSKISHESLISYFKTQIINNENSESKN